MTQRGLSWAQYAERNKKTYLGSRRVVSRALPPAAPALHSLKLVFVGLRWGSGGNGCVVGGDVERRRCRYICKQSLISKRYAERNKKTYLVSRRPVQCDLGLRQPLKEWMIVIQRKSLQKLSYWHSVEMSQALWCHDSISGNLASLLSNYSLLVSL
jgi:hypothetical protein